MKKCMDDSLPPQENQHWPSRCFELLVVPLQYCNPLKGSMKFIIITYLKRSKYIFMLLEAQTHLIRDASYQSTAGWSVHASAKWFRLEQFSCLSILVTDVSLQHVYQWGKKKKKPADGIMNNNWHTKHTRSFQTTFHRPCLPMENTAEQITRSWLFLRITSLAFLPYNHNFLHKKLCIFILTQTTQTNVVLIRKGTQL